MMVVAYSDEFEWSPVLFSLRKPTDGIRSIRDTTKNASSTLFLESYLEAATKTR